MTGHQYEADRGSAGLFCVSIALASFMSARGSSRIMFVVVCMGMLSPRTGFVTHNSYVDLMCIPVADVTADDALWSGFVPRIAFYTRCQLSIRKCKLNRGQHLRRRIA